MPLTLQIVSDQAEDLGSRARMVFGESGGTIGRTRMNDWVLPDTDRVVSAHHATISCVDGKYCLTDTSTNGVFVNDGVEPVGQGNRVSLTTGDQLTIGPYRITVDAGPTPEHAVGPARVVPEDATVVSTAAERGEVDPVAAFWQGVGVAARELSPDENAALMHQVGLVVRHAAGALMELLRGRAEFKSELRAPITVMRATGNNPLKFSATVDEALRWLLVERGAGYLPPVDSFLEGFDDIRAHESAAVAAMRSTLETATRRLEVAQAAGQGADSLYAALMEEFASAYQAEVDRLSTVGKDAS